MKYRKLRIAWSVGCGVLVVLFIALWVRSTWVADGVGIPVGSRATISVRSITGRLIVTYHAVGRPRTWVAWHGDFDDFQLVEARLADDTLGFGYFPSAQNKSAIVPHWFFVAFFATLASVPNIRWSKRFSLRTMLIVTTLIAVGLGLIMYVARS